MKTIQETKFPAWPRLFCLALGTALLATGCQTYKQQNKTVSYWQQGDLKTAVVEAKKKVDENANNKDTVIWRLEQGAVLRAAGQFADSNDTFDRAQQKMDDYAQKAKVRVGQEAGALLSNQAELDYEGRAYDGIMLNTYRALNFLALGETDKARPELIKAYQRQQDAVEANKKRIEMAQNEVKQSTNSVAIEKAQKDEKLKTQLAGITSGMDQMKVYADYVNPFTVYLDGLYFLANAADASDLERAHKSFERTVSFAPDNPYVKQDLAVTEDAMNGKRLAPITYVVFETGCAPVRDQIRIDIPIIVSKVSYVGAAFPTLKFQNNYLSSLTVSTAETNYTTSLVGSMDSVVALDFKNELPVVITKTIASTVIKAVAAYAINKGAGNAGGGWAGLIAQVATAGYQAAVNIADTRTWTTLPKEYQVARLATPTDGKIVLAGPGGCQRTEVTVDCNAINLVYVKSINANTPLLVINSKLNGAPIHLAVNSGGQAGSSAPAQAAAQTDPPARSDPPSPSTQPPAKAAVPETPATVSDPTPPAAPTSTAPSAESPAVTPPATVSPVTPPSAPEIASTVPPAPSAQPPPVVTPKTAVLQVPETTPAPAPVQNAVVEALPANSTTIAETPAVAPSLSPVADPPAAMVVTPVVTTPPAKTFLTDPATSSPAQPIASPTSAGGMQAIIDPQVRSLCETLRSDKPRDVVEALRVLRRIDATEAVGQILPCLNHYDPSVVREACRALAVVGGPDVIPSLQPLLQDHREDVRRDAQFAIKDLERKSGSAL